MLLKFHSSSHVIIIVCNFLPCCKISSEFVKFTAMVDVKKGAVTEEDVCTLLQRYSAVTVLALLKEVSQFADVKIDWKILVKNTKAGIKSAGEYQMLWRHLAYRQPLIENLGSVDQPLDDDSDLEYELEACSPVSSEAAMEAVNSVKKKSQAAETFGEGVDANGSTNNRKRRKSWSEEEDSELITAVQKFGEGNWAAIVKGYFNGNRNAKQLAQRWNIIRKKQGALNIGGAKTAGAQVTEAQLVGDGTAGTNTAEISVSKMDLPVPESSAVTCTTSVKPAPVTSVPKALPKKQMVQPSVSTDSTDSIPATAVAAEACVVSSSSTASLLKGVKAVQSKNAVHVRESSSVIKTSAAGSLTPLPPNVHFIRTGLTPTTSKASGTASLTSQSKANAIRPPVPPAAVSQLSEARTTATVAMERIIPAQHMENTKPTEQIISAAVNEGSRTEPMI